MKKRVAIFVPGSLGDPSTRYQVPAQVDLVIRLAHDFDITVYSLIKVDGDNIDFNLGDAKVTFVQARWSDGGVRKIYSFLRECLRDHRVRPYDLVHGFWAVPTGTAAVMFGTFARIPSLVSVLGGEAAAIPDLAYGNMVRNPARALTRWSCLRATGLTLLTHDQHARLRAFGVRRDDVLVVPYGVSTSRFQRRTARALAPPYRLLHVGNLAPVKDQATLLRAFQRIVYTVPATLRVIGADHMNGTMQRLASTLGVGDSVTFLGHIHHAELPAHFAWADALLHTSRYESQGVVVAEAAAAGAAICGTRVGLIADLGEEMTVAVEPGDAELLATRVLALLGDPERFAGMTRRAFAWAASHDSDWTARQYLQLYNRLISQRRRDPATPETISRQTP